MRLLLPFVLFAVGCATETNETTKTDTSSQDISQQDSSQEDTLSPTETEIPSATNGTAPSTEIGPPTFTATNSDYAARTQQDLIGQPTVIWFFPFSATPG